VIRLKNIKIKDKTNFSIAGEWTIEAINKDGEVLKRRSIKNIVVETGIEFILDLLIDSVALYSGNTRLLWMAAGSINTAATVDDWALRGEGTLNEGGATCRVQLDAETGRSEQTITFVGVFTDGDFPVLPYDIAELGVFLGNRPPTSDPQEDATQRPYAMFNRSILNPVWNKENDNISLRFRYRLTISGS